MFPSTRLICYSWQAVKVCVKVKNRIITDPQFSSKPSKTLGKRAELISYPPNLKTYLASKYKSHLPPKNVSHNLILKSVLRYINY